MKYKSMYRRALVQAVVGGSLLVGMSAATQANTTMSTGSNPVTNTGKNFMQFVRDSGINFGGWVNGGATFNPSQTDGFNGPVTFGDQANRDRKSVV